MKPSSFTHGYRLHALNTLYEAMGAAVNPNSCDLVVLSGVLQRDRLHAAIAATLARHPVLRGKPLSLRYHALTDADPERVDAYLQSLIWTERFSSEQSPVRFHVTEVAGRTYFQTIHTHVYADATACYLLTEQIAASYSGRPLAAVESTKKPKPMRGTRFGSSFIQRLSGLAQTVRDVRASFGGLAIPQRAVPGQRRLARFVFSPNQTKQLRQTARDRGCSLHALFQLAFLRTGIEFNRDRGVSRSHLRLWDFFSMRSLRDDEAPRYDCLALVYPVELDARKSDAEILKYCTDTIEELRTGGIVAHAFRFDSLMALFGPGRASRLFARVWPALFKSNVLLTNPGIVPSTLAAFGDVPVVDYVTFPQLFAPAEVMLVFSTFRGSLRVLAVYDETALADAFHAGLFTPFLHTLGQLCGLDLSSVATADGFVAQWHAESVGQRMSA